VTTGPVGEGLRRTVFIVTGIDACASARLRRGGANSKRTQRAARKHARKRATPERCRTTGERTMCSDVIERLQRATQSGKE
jgi:hypothetical protein